MKFCYAFSKQSSRVQFENPSLESVQNIPINEIKQGIELYGMSQLYYICIKKRLEGSS